MKRLLNSLCISACFMTGSALAESANPARLPLVPAYPSDPTVGKIFDGVRQRGSEPLNMHRTLSHSPQIFKAYVDLAYALRASAKVPRVFRELIILRMAQLSKGEYEFAQHRPMALSCGISTKQIDSLATWHTAEEFDPKQRAVLAYAEAMASSRDVNDETFANLQQHFDTQEIVELTLTAAFYSAASRTTNALGVKLEPAAGNSDQAYGKC